MHCCVKTVTSVLSNSFTLNGVNCVFVYFNVCVPVYFLCCNRGLSVTNKLICYVMLCVTELMPVLYVIWTVCVYLWVYRVLYHNLINKCFSKKHIPPYGPLLTPNSGHPWGYRPQSGRRPVRNHGRTGLHNFTPIGKAPAEKSVTVQKGTVNLVFRTYYGMVG